MSFTQRTLIAALAAFTVAATVVVAQEQEVPSVIELNGLYDGQLVGTSTHVVDLPSAGSYAIFVAGDTAMRITVSPPSGRVFERTVSSAANNFIFIEAASAGSLSFTVEVDDATMDYDPFYGFVVSGAQLIDPAEAFSGNLEQGVEFNREAGAGIGMFTFVADDDAELLLTAEGPQEELTMIVGSDDDVIAEPDYSRTGFEGGRVVVERLVRKGRQYGILVIAELDERSRRPAAVTLDFELSPMVTLDPSPLAFETPVTGTLGGRLPLVGGRRARPYVFSAPAGTPVAVLLRSEEMDTYLYVETPAGELLADDDGASGTDSLITLTLPEAGEYVVYVSSYGGSEMGNYELLLTDPETADGMIAETQTEFFEEPFIPEEDFIVSVAPIRVGDRVEGEITAEGSVFEGKYSEVFELALEGGEAVAVDLQSPDFDTYLTVVGPDGEYFTNDDFGDGYDSRLTIQAERDGLWTIYATSFSGSSTGSFTLEVSETEPTTLAESAVAERLFAGDIRSGAISFQSPVFRNAFVEVFEYDARSGEEIQIALYSEELDSYLYAVAPDGTLYSDDDGAGNLDSLIVIESAVGGTYRIYASSLGGDSVGSFTIELQGE